MKRTVTLASVLGLATLTLLLVAIGRAAEQAVAAEGKTPRLWLKVLRTLPEPVIGQDTPGAERIPGGFEGGNSVKVVIDGKPQVHFFAHSYPTLGWGRSQLDHWTSDDGQTFRRADVMLADYEDQATGMKHIFTAPIPFFSEQENRWYLSYGEFVAKLGGGWSPTAGTMGCAPSKAAGPAGVAGPYDFGKCYEHVPLQSWSKRPVSNGAPFQVKDGRWAILVCPHAEVEKDAGRWPIWLSFSSTPLGPFPAPPQPLVLPMIEPTGFTENPLPVKVKGPKAGRDYWVAVFDFLAPEVTPYVPKNVIGFSWSEDGIHWPKEHGQVVNVDDGLPKGRQGWWRGSWAIRTPHQMLDEGDGTYTIYFTGATTEKYFEGFRAVGKVTVRLVED